jgi:hypothetical protein
MNKISCIDKIKGEVCWLALAGNGNGSMVTLHFGEKIERKQNYSDQKETISLSNRYKGQYCIFIKGCSWRLELEGKMLVSWRDAEEKMTRFLKSLEGLRVSDILVINMMGDLRLAFDTGYILTLFCDQTDGADSMENYSVRIPGEWISFGPGSRVDCEPAHP